MKQGFELRLGQKLSLTPQLQQAIRLLQMSTLELQQEIQTALETNPLLEQVEAYSDIETADPKERTDTDASLQENIPDEISSDSNWEDTYDTSSWDMKPSTAPADDTNLLETLNAEKSGLREHLLWQVNASKLNVQDRIIAEALIESLDERGFLTQSLDAIFEDLGQELLIDKEDVEAIHGYLLHLDPLGVAATCLQECLIVQLEYRHQSHPLYRKARALLEKNLDLLTKRDYKKIKRVLNLDDEQYTEMIQMLQSLDPHPGEAYEPDSIEYIKPDVYIHKTEKGQWFTSLSSTMDINIRVNEYYRGLIGGVDNTRDKQYLKNNLQEANSLIKAIENRNSTILRVANEIIRRQADFLKYGAQAMKPMILKDIADTLEVHESTISRVTNQKYMMTPHGIFELKYFFSSHVGTSAGGQCSSTAICAMIQDLIKDEDSKKPLSDSKLCDLLKDQGINVARRTITKYRESLTIPSSRERKSLA